MQITKIPIKSKIQIEVTFWKLDNADNQAIAATEYLKHLDGITKNRRISDTELDKMNDLVESVISVLKKHKFNVQEGHQSGGGYSWYQPFYPTLSTGEVLDEYAVTFRISNHTNPGVPDNAPATNNIQGIIIKSFTLGSDQYPTTVSILKAVNETCSAIEYLGYEGID